MSFRDKVRSLQFGGMSAKQPGATEQQHATPKGTGDAMTHAQAAVTAHKSGNHKGARSSHFAAIRAIDANRGGESASNGGTGDEGAGTAVKTSRPGLGFPPSAS